LHRSARLLYPVIHHRAVAQDWMCEPFVLQKTGKTVEEHQDLTLKSSVALSPQTSAYVMPVLQGFSPKQYASHVRQYGELLEFGQWVGVGSVCK